MQFQETNYLNDVIEVYPSNIGKIFFYTNLIIVEAKEGVHINYENTKDVYKKIKAFFGERSFGLVSNRINNYSIEVLDYNKLFKKLPNLTAYGIVCYNLKSTYNVEIEKAFSKVPFHGYNKLKDALNGTINLVNGKK